MTTTLADLRSDTLHLAEELLSTTRVRTPEVVAMARRDAFIEVLFAALLTMPDVNRAYVLKARRLYWWAIRNPEWEEYGWERALLACLEAAGDSNWEGDLDGA